MICRCASFSLVFSCAPSLGIIVSLEQEHGGSEDILETKNCNGFLPVHFGFETAFDPLLGSVLASQEAAAKEAATSDSSRNCSDTDDNRSSHECARGGGGGRRRVKRRR